MDTPPHHNFNSPPTIGLNKIQSNPHLLRQQQSPSSSSLPTINQPTHSNNKYTVHDIYETTHGDLFILSSLSTRKDTQIIRIEGRCGMLLFEGIQGVDLFPNHRAATAYLQKKYTFKSKLRAFAILGYIITEKSSHLLVATKVRNEGELLGVHTVHSVLEHQWIKIELSYLNSYQSNENQQTEGSWTTTLLDDHPESNTDSSPGDLEKILKDLQSFPFESTHFYCESYDLTNYFPSNQITPFQYCPEFTWNEWLRKPFENSNLSHLCIVLLQGFVSIKPISQLNVSVGYIMKRSKVNPGTNLFSPGINESAGPANEYECEIVMWKYINSLSSSLTNVSLNNNSSNINKSSNSQNQSLSPQQQQQQQQQNSNVNNTPSSLSSSNSSVQNHNHQHQFHSHGQQQVLNNGNIIEWTSHLWRRGTVPLWWRSMPKSQGSTEVELFLKDKNKENPYENTDLYYSNLLSRFAGFYEGRADVPAIHLVNLLRLEITDHKNEGILTSQYQKSSENAMSLLNCHLDMVHFDWLSNLKNNNNNLSKTVQMLWEASKYSLDSSGISSGLIKVVSSTEDQVTLSPNHSSFSPSQPSSAQPQQLSSLLSSPLLLNSNNTTGNNNPLKKSTGISTQFYESPLDSHHSTPSSLSNSTGSTSDLNHTTHSNHTTTTSNGVNLTSSLPSSFGLTSTSTTSNQNGSDKKLIYLNYTPQREIMRYSCLDSLERVNVAVFFNSFQILAMMGTKLGIGFHDLLGFGQISLEFMINTFKKLGLFSALSEFFLTSTEICSVLYTNNPAQPPPIIREFINTTSFLLSQRKYQGNLSAENRCHQYFLILGGGGNKLFPFNSSTGKEISPYWISSPPSTAVMALPSIFEGSNLSSNILVRDIDDFCWILPNGMQSVEVVIYLGQPSVVTELCLTISHGTNTDTYPQSMDVLLGNYLNEMHYVLQDILLPRCTTGTKLSYILPKVPWESYSNSLNSLNNIPVDRYLNRVVKIRFYGQVTPITLGKIEVFGYHSNSFNNNNINLFINPTYRNSFDRYQRNSISAGSGSNSDYTPILRKGRVKEQSNQSSSGNRNDKIYNTLVNDQIDNILDILNSENTKNPTDEIDLKSLEQSIEKLNNSDNSSFGNSPSFGSPNQETNKLKKLSEADEIVLISDYNGDNSFSKATSSQNSSNSYKSTNSNDTSSNNNISPTTTPSNNEAEETITIFLGGNEIGGSKTDPPIKQYEFQIKRLLNLNKEGKILTLLEVLDLEAKRIQLGVTPWERDNLIKSIGISSNLLNPERFIFERDEKTESQIRKSNKYKSSICQRPQCGKPLAFLDKIRQVQCNYCYKRFCPACVSSNQVKILEFSSQKLISVCNLCATLIAKQEQLFEKINNHNRDQHIQRSKINLSFYQKVLLDSTHNQNNVNQTLNNVSSIPLSYETMSKTLMPLAEYPKGGILNSVPTDPSSPPIETILLPPGVLPLNMYWYAPASVNTVDLVILLSYESQAYSISLIADTLGYHSFDLPNVEVRIAKSFTGPENFESIGQWVFHPNGWSTTDPSLIIQPQSAVSYILPQPVQARAISLRFTLPNLPEFLKYDNESPISRFLHIGRVTVHGTFSDSLVDISTGTSSSIPLEPSHKELYENILYTNSISQRRNPIKVNTLVKSNSKILHITPNIPNTPIKGFSLIMGVDEKEGVKSQIKGLTLSCITTNQKNESVSHQFIAQILVPKSRQNSTLYFDLPNIPPMIQTLVFEFTSNYGGKITSLPKVLIN